MSAGRLRPPRPWWLEEGSEQCCACLTFHQCEACVHCAACDRPVCASCAVEDRDEAGVVHRCPECLAEGWP
jgi:hypothetical protein